jgi:hypothetical protein
MTDSPSLPRALLRMLPWALLLLPFLLQALWLRLSDAEDCAPQLLGLPQSYLSLLAMTVGLPSLMLLYSLTRLPEALRSLRNGARLRARLHACLMLLAPLLAVAVLALGLRAFEGVMQGRDVSELQRASEADCSRP